MSEFLLPDHELPGLHALFNDERWAEWESKHGVPHIEWSPEAIQHFELEPSGFARLVVSDGIDDAVWPWLVELYPDVDSAQQRWELAQARIALDEHDPAPLFDEECAAIAYPFPVDPDLPALARSEDRSALRTTLKEMLPPEYSAQEWRIQRRRIRLQVLSYRPGKKIGIRVRARLRAKTGDATARMYWYLSVLPPLRAEAAAVTHEALEEALAEHPSVSIPGLRGVGLNRTAIAVDWIDGRPLSAFYGRKPEVRHSFLRKSGTALAALHGVDANLVHKESPPELATELRDLGAQLAQTVPALAHRIEHVADTLASDVAQFALLTSSIVHGAFHGEQLLFDRDDRPFLVDLARAGRGYAVLDLGELEAELILRECPESDFEAFLDGYTSAGAKLPPPEALEIATPVALFRRLGLPLTHPTPEWTSAIHRQLDQLESRLGARR